MAGPHIGQIKIKTDVVKRLAKERVMCEKEANQQEEKTEKMKTEDPDDYSIKKQIEADLVQLLENEKEFEETDEYKDAFSVLESIKLEA
nr:PREDICTED: tubulin-specific chaperone A-like [Anolis carolinensis]|eukprot:XP_016849550.1 PREDICTED: tubulin-specific chaperone A-like [Anolis carolinensis]